MSGALLVIATSSMPSATAPRRSCSNQYLRTRTPAATGRWCLPKIGVFYTAPTAILLDGVWRRTGQEARPLSLRILGTVGEPINPEAWRWYFQVGATASAPSLSIGRRRRAAVRPVPVTPMKPGSCLPFFGVEPKVLDAQAARKSRGRKVAEPMESSSGRRGLPLVERSGATTSATWPPI